MAFLVNLPPSLPRDTKVLDLRHNQLFSLKSLNGSYFENITTLFLTFNNISNLDYVVLPSQLEELWLDHNSLMSLSDYTIQLLSRLKQLRLGNNLWQCNCSIVPLHQFLLSNYSIVMDMDTITCGEERLISLTLGDVCPALPVQAFIISSVIVSIAILSTGTVFVYYRYWKVLRLWFFVRGYCSCLLLEEEIDQNRTYDAFVSYAQEDEAFVVGELRPHLEDKEPHFSLLLHFRNWLPGAQIHDNVINSISSSKRTLVILSSAYVASPWCQSEFRLAFHHQIETQMNRLIVIVMGELPPALPEEMQLYVSQNTYIRYGEPCFWEKLQYALPHYKQHKKNNQNHRDDGIQLVDGPL